MSFVHLHTHTEYSILDGYTRVGDLAKIAKEHGDAAVAQTDHGSLGGSLPFWEACKEQEIKSLFGVETYVTPDLDVKDKDSPTWHLILIAMNQTGRNNLFAMSKIAWTRGFYRKPRVDHKTLAAHSEGVICISACMASEVVRALESGTEKELGDDRWNADPKKAIDVARIYAGIFPGRYYIELQPGNPRVLNEKLSMIADVLNLPKVVTVDSHYDHCESKSNEELLLTMQQVSGFKKSDRDFAYLQFDEAKREPTLLKRLRKLWPNKGLSFEKHDLHLMTRAEVVERMNLQGFDGNALADMTLQIADRCEQVEFQIGKNYLPKLNDSFDSAEWLRELVYDGLEARGLHKDQRYIDRVEYELGVIDEKGFNDYFLIVWDIYNEARRRNIYVGPGRGSAAGCLVAYALRIVNIDPIKYKLLFFRFINPDRMDFPDIDMDFEHRGRDEMKTYMEERHGERLGLATYSRFKARGLVADISKALGMKESEIRAATKHFSTLDEYEEAEALKGFRARHPEILPLARELEGHVSGTGAHAAAVVVADRPMSEICPVESRTDPEDKKLRIPVSGFDMGDAEKVGLIKFDFLGLVNLTIIHDAIDLIKERHGIDVDWENLEPDDPDVLAMLDGQNTVGVFQMESTQYRNLISQQGIDNFNDMAASNALVRPGAYETVAKDYIKRKHGREEVTYPHPDMIEWLEDTYGLVVYQEQVMMAAVVLGGFTQGEAEKLRKIIGKKRDAAEFQPFYEKWIVNAGEKIGEKAAEKLWHEFEKHAGYSFNKSHAVAYSYVSYVTAYLKYHYPIEYIYAMLRNEKAAMTKMTYLLEARRLGIEILGPDVNYSAKEMSVQQDSLRFGLTDVKQVGAGAADHVIKLRPFPSWGDWGERIVAQKCNARVVENLQSVDAFRSIPDGPHNSEPEKNYMDMLNYPLDLEHVADIGINYNNIDQYDENVKDDYMVVCGVTKSIKRTATYVRIELEDITGKMTCFGSMDNDLNEGEVILALVGEKSMVGYARVDGLKERIANKTLDKFETLLVGDPFGPLVELYSYGMGKLGDKVALVLPINIRRITTKTGKRMAFATLTDGEQIVKVTIFDRTWREVENIISEHTPICVRLESLKDGGQTLSPDGVIDAASLLQQRKKQEKGSNND